MFLTIRIPCESRRGKDASNHGDLRGTHCVFVRDCITAIEESGGDTNPGPGRQISIKDQERKESTRLPLLGKITVREKAEGDIICSSAHCSIAYLRTNSENLCSA